MRSVNSTDMFSLSFLVRLSTESINSLQFYCLEQRCAYSYEGRTARREVILVVDQLHDRLLSTLLVSGDLAFPIKLVT